MTYDATQLKNIQKQVVKSRSLLSLHSDTCRLQISAHFWSIEVICVASGVPLPQALKLLAVFHCHLRGVQDQNILLQRVFCVSAFGAY
jgi:hypothetical protein